MRTFVAIEIPDVVKEGLAKAQDRLKGAGVDAGWPQSEGIHLTLKFLGETSDQRVPQIVQALALELDGAEPFRLSPKGVGTFPNPASARVVWVGITGDIGRLVALQAAVEKAVVGMGMERDDRPYTPHLTLGRIKRVRKPDVWLKELEGIKNFRLPGFDVTAISLISSELRPSGAVYREFGRVALK
jgi:2'-5' RNA ligase